MPVKRRATMRLHGTRAEGVGKAIVPAVVKATDSTSDPTFFLTLRQMLGATDLTKPYSQHVWAYACIRALATNIAGVPFEIRTGTRKDPKTVESGPWVDVFEAPNPLTSRYQLWEATIIYLSLARGECMWVLEGRGAIRMPGEIPTEIWPHPGDHFTPIIRNGVIAAWEFRNPHNGSLKNYLPHQVIQFKNWNPYDPIRGLGPMAVALAAIRQDLKASRFNEAFFDNGADIGGLLKSDKRLAPEKESQLRTQFEERHQGPKNRGKIAVLHGGLDYVPNEQTHKDMEFLEQRKWTRDEVLAAFRVPKTELSLYEDVNYATAQTQDKAFWQKTLIPMMRYIEDVLGQHLFGPAKGNEWGAFDLGVVEALQADFGTKTETAERLWRMGYPINVVNERLQLGLPKVAWGDEVLVPISQTTASSLVDGADATPDAGSAADGGGSAGGGTPPPAPGKGKTAPVVKQDRSQDPVALAWWGDYIGKVFAPREKEFMVKLRVYFGALKREVLDRLDHVASGSKAMKDLTRDQVDQILFLEEEWNRKLRATLGPSYKRTVQSAIAQIGVELGDKLPASFDGLDPNVLRFLREKEVKVTEINVTTRERLRQTIFDGIAEGDTVNGLQDRIKNAFNTLGGDARRLTIARTETAQTLSGVRQMAFEAAGVEKQRWITAGDEAVRESHASQDGDVREVGDKFPNGLEYPSEIGGPPEEVINCRCVAVAVPKETPVSEE